MDIDSRVIHWIKTVLDEASKLDNGRGIELLHACGKECASQSEFLEGAVKIRNKYISDIDLDKLFNEFKQKYYNKQNFTKEGDKIVLVFEECTCPIVKAGVNNQYLCNCTVGYTRKIFEALFNRAVKVDLEKSILKGDKICRQVIRLL